MTTKQYLVNLVKRYLAWQRYLRREAVRLPKQGLIRVKRFRFAQRVRREPVFAIVAVAALIISSSFVFFGPDRGNVLGASTTDTLVPNADSTITGWGNGTGTTGGTGDSSCTTYCDYIDDASDSTYLSTSTDGDDGDKIDVDFPDVTEEANLTAVTEVVVTIRWQTTAVASTADTVGVDLFIDGGWDGVQTFTPSTSTEDRVVTFNGSAVTSATTASDVRVELIRNKLGTGPGGGRDDTILVYDIEIDVSYDYTGPAGPPAALTLEGYAFENTDGPGVAGPLLEDTFTGTNGSAWDTSKWTDVSLGSSVVDIQSNRGQVADDGADVSRVYSYELDSTIDAYFTAQKQNTGSKGNVGIKVGTDWDADFDEDANNGYWIFIKDGQPSLSKNDAGTFTSINGAWGSDPGTTDYWYRFQYDGTTVRAKMWTGNKTDEPVAWGAEEADSAHEGSTFRFFMSSYGSSTLLFDNLTVNSLNAADENSVVAGSEFTTGKTLTQVRQGEAINLRAHLSNNGGPLDENTELGLFYDKNDGIWTKVQSTVPKVDSTGSGCADTDWNCTVIDATGAVGHFTDVAVDPAGNLVIAYHDSGGKDLNIARYVGSGGDCDTLGAGSDAWSCEIIDSTGDTGRYVSIDFDQNGDPWIAYYDITNANLRIAQFVGASGSGCASSAWTCTTVDATNDVGQYSSLAFYNGTPYIAYAYTTGGDLRFAEYTGSGSESSCAGGSSNWDCTDIETTADVGDYASLAFDGTGTAWISYRDDDSNSLRIATNSAGSGCATSAWTCANLNVTGNVGQDSSLAILPDGSPAVAYRDETNKDLEYAVYTGTGTESSCAGGSADWDCEIVESADSVGDFASLAIDPSGNPWISYYEPDHGTASCDSGDCNLKVARYVGTGGTGCATTAWECIELQTTDDVGRYTSIAFMPNGQPLVAYFDFTSGDLEFAWRDTRAGELTIVPTISGSNGDVLTESHADMTSSTDTTGRDDADCLNATTWNNGTYFEAENGRTTIADGQTTSQCTEVMWTIDTSQATPGTTYRFVVATDDAFNPSSGTWRGPVSVATDGYPTLTIADAEQSTYLYSKFPTYIPSTDCTDTGFGCAVVDDGGADSLEEADVAISPSGIPWLVFQNGSQFNLEAAYYVGAGGSCSNPAWECMTVDTSMSDRPNVLFDAAGDIWITTNGPSVARYVGSGGDCSNTAFECYDVDTTTTSNWEVPIALDDSGNPVIAYYSTSNALYFARFVGSGGSCDDPAWDGCTAIDTSEVATDLSIAVSDQGRVRIAYQGGSTESVSDIRLAEYVGSGGTGCATGVTQWTCIDIQNNSNQLGDYLVKLVHDFDDNPWISYYDSTRGSLWVAEYDGVTTGSCSASGWKCTEVHDNATDAIGRYNEIEIAPDGSPWIKYHNDNDGTMYVAKYVGGTSGTGCEDGSTAWSCSLILATGAGNESGLSFGPDGSAWIGFIDISNGDVEVAKLKQPTFKPTIAVSKAYDGQSYASTLTAGILSSGTAPYSSYNSFCGGVSDYLGYCGVYDNDGQYDSIVAQANERPVYGFATRLPSNTTLPTAVLNFQTNTSPSTNNVVVQAYRFGSTNAWETVATYSTAGCSTNNCRINALPTGTVSEYFEVDGSEYWIYFRAYQVESTSSITFKVDSFSAEITQSYFRGGRTFREQRSDPLGW
jgi:hypothetical protein